MILMTLLSITVSSQNLRTGYFLDGYSYKYQFNPAFQGERGFIALPVFSKLSFGLESTIAIKDFLYPTASGTLGTFLHPEVPADVVMKNLSNRTMLNANLDINLLGVGFRVKKTYHTIDVSLRANADATLPGDIFRFMKVGGSDGNSVYNLSNLGLSNDSYAQIAYGFSRRFYDKFNVGIRLKALVGVESIRMNISDLTLKMDSDQWMVNAAGGATMSSIPAGLVNKEEIDIMKELTAIAKSPNIGVAMDFGVSVDLFEYLTLSASILDLGYINWKNSEVYSLSSEPWVYEGFEFSLDESSSSNLDEQFDSKLSELLALFNFDDLTPDVKSKHKQSLSMTLHVGAEARMPFYERLSVGALATHRFNGVHSWTEGRFSLNLAPLRWLSLAANYAISDFGHSFGGALNIHPKGFSMFLGTDSFRPYTSFSPNRIPLNDLNTNFVFGVNFPFGKYNGRFPKKEKASKNPETISEEI